MNPNERKYFDADNGCSLNGECVNCSKPVWFQEGVYTVYEGKKFLHNRTDQVMGVWTKVGVVCEKCYIPKNEES